MKLLLTLLLVAFCTTQIAAQNILIVDNTRVGEVQPPVYEDLQAAIDAAQAGDVIHVMPSVTSYGNIEINKPISLFGAGIIREPGKTGWSEVGAITFKTGASNIRLSGLKGTGTWDIGIDIDGLLIDKCVLTSLRKSSSETALANVIFSNSIFTHMSMSTGGISNLSIKNNIIRNASISTAHLQNNLLSGLSIQFCNVVNNIFLGNPSGYKSTFVNNVFLANIPETRPAEVHNLRYGNVVSGSVTGTPDFENYDDSSITELSHDFHLKSDSKGKNAGTDGKDLGIYGGDTPFEDLGGALPAVLSITGPVMVPAGEDVTVEIKATAY
jgi:hypothetical protein